MGVQGSGTLIYSLNKHLKNQKMEQDIESLFIVELQQGALWNI